MKKLTITIISIIISLQAFSQKEEWIREFWNYEKTGMTDLITTYDHGYLLLTYINWNYSIKWAWMIKTDVNGEILWDKKIGNGMDGTIFKSVYQDSGGEFLLAGSTVIYDAEKGDSFFMKLNSCGEKEWCRIFNKAGSGTSYDYGANIFPLENKVGYIALVGQWGDDFGPGVFKGIWIFRLDMNGNLLWIKNVFDEVHPEAWNEIPESMIKSKYLTDEGKEKFVITAWTIYNDFGLPYGWGKTMMCAVDEDGDELWWAIHHQDEPYNSKPENSVEDKYGNIYTVGRDESYNDGTSDYYPALFKTGKNGEKLFQKYIIDNTQKANAFCINIMNDTILDIGGVWKYHNQPNFASIARTDTSGNLILDKKVLQNEASLYRSTKTIDNKQLYMTFVPFGTSYIKVLLFKFNYDLEYDTLYTQPFDYDYLCDNLPIASDTIGIDDCDIWTGFPGEIEYRAAKYLLIFPNPADNRVTIQLPEYTADEQKWGTMTSRHYNLQYHKDAVLRVFDLFGRQVMEHSLRNTEGDSVELDISNLTSGIYLINLFEKDKLMSSGKFVKK
ncbi:MAG: T9SS type A sorting domain-containing protein [Bacteroidales bacterium]